MNKSTGEIELNGISFGNDTSIDEVLGSSKFQSHINKDGLICISRAKQVAVDGYTFNIKIVFKNKRLDKIELDPVNLEMKDPGYPDEKYQEEKKKVADSYLRENLGDPPDESEAVLYYEFDWGSVASVAFLSGRNEYTGGFIVISYK